MKFRLVVDVDVAPNVMNFLVKPGDQGLSDLLREAIAKD